MHKKIFAVFMITILFVTLSACKQDDRKTIVLITDINGLNDNFYNQQANDGLKKAAKDFDFDLTVLQSKTKDDYEINLEKAIELKPQIIVISSPLLESAAVPYAQIEPDINFIFIDSAGDLNLDNMQDSDNIFSVEFNRSQAGFLSGIVAGSASTSSVLFVGAKEFPAYIEYESGFKAGVKAANSEVSVEVVYFDEDIDTDKAKETTASYLANGCEVIYTLNKNQGIYEAADNAGISVIGYDYNYSNLIRKGANSIQMFVVKKIDNTVYQAVSEYFNGSFKGQIKYYSIADNAFEIIKNNNKLVTNDIQVKLDSWIEKLKIEDITLPKTRTEADQFIPPVITTEQDEQTEQQDQQ